MTTQGAAPDRPGAGIELVGGFDTTYQPEHDRDLAESTAHDVRWRADLDLLESCGVTRLRYPVRWHRVESAPGVFDWSETDRIFEKPRLRARRHRPRSSPAGGEFFTAASTVSHPCRRAVCNDHTSKERSVATRRNVGGRASDRRDTRSDLRTAARIVGVVFLVVGILGFIPGITTDFDTLTFAGPESDAKLFGIFEVSILHNIVHLLFGVLGLVASRTASASKTYLIGGGIVYLGLWLYGLLVDQSSDANFVPLNTADNWLHLFLGVAMVGLGVLLASRTAEGRRHPASA